MFSRRPEVAPDRSGRPERINYSEPGIAWHGRRLGARLGAMAASARRGDPVDRRPEHAFAAGLGLEKRQYLSFAGKLHRGRSFFAGRQGAREEVTSPPDQRHDAFTVEVRAGGLRRKSSPTRTASPRAYTILLPIFGESFNH